MSLSGLEELKSMNNLLPVHFCLFQNSKMANLNRGERRQSAAMITKFK